MGHQVPPRRMREEVVFALLKINLGAGIYPPPISAPSGKPTVVCAHTGPSGVSQGECQIFSGTLSSSGPGPLCFPLLPNPLWSRLLTLPPT